MRVYRIVWGTVAAASVLALFACTGGGGASVAGMANILPEKDYIGVVGFKPNEALNAGIVKRITAESETAEKQIDSSKKEFESVWGLKIEDVQHMTMFFNTSMDMNALHLTSPINAADFKGRIEKEKEVEFEEKDISGQKCFLGREAASFAVTDLAGGIVLGDAGTFENLMKAIKASGTRLAQNEEYGKALQLADPNATAYGTTWGKDNLTAGIGAFAGMLTRGDENAAEAIEKLNAAGMSLYLADDVRLNVRIKFDDADAAKTMADFINNLKPMLIAQAATLGQLSGASVKPEDAKRIIDKLNVAAAGETVEINITIVWDDIKGFWQEG